MLTTDNPCKHVSKHYVGIVQKLSVYIIGFIVVGYFLHVKTLMFSTRNNKLSSYIALALHYIKVVHKEKSIESCVVVDSITSLKLLMKLDWDKL